MTDAVEAREKACIQDTGGLYFISDWLRLNVMHYSDDLPKTDPRLVNLPTLKSLQEIELHRK